MALDLAGDLAALFSTVEFAETGTFTPSGGSGASVVVHLLGPDTDDDLGGYVGVVDRAWRALVRASEVAAPVKGDGLAVGSRSFEVDKVMADETGLVWTLVLVDIT